MHSEVFVEQIHSLIERKANPHHILFHSCKEAQGFPARQPQGQPAAFCKPSVKFLLDLISPGILSFKSQRVTSSPVWFLFLLRPKKGHGDQVSCPMEQEESSLKLRTEPGFRSSTAPWRLAKPTEKPVLTVQDSGGVAGEGWFGGSRMSHNPASYKPENTKQVLTRPYQSSLDQEGGTEHPSWCSTWRLAPFYCLPIPLMPSFLLPDKWAENGNVFS